MSVDLEHYDRALGAVLGALVGDALGGVLEFINRKPTPRDVEWALGMPGGGVFDLAPGQFTDDGEMTIALLNALLIDRKFRPEHVANSYIAWANSKPFDIGIATQNALLSGIPPDSAALQFNSFSQANGCLMRIAPLAVTGSTFGNYRTPHVWKAFERDARLTHPHKNCVDSSRIYGTTLCKLIIGEGFWTGSHKEIHEYRSQIPQCHPGSEVDEWLDDVERGELPYAREKIGWAKIAFSLAFHHLFQESTFTAAMRQTLLLGGDTDTNACIVGAMMGARFGASAIPTEWCEAVLMCDTSKGSQPRPADYSAAYLENKIKHLLYMR